MTATASARASQCPRMQYLSISLPPKASPKPGSSPRWADAVTRMTVSMIVPLLGTV